MPGGAWVSLDTKAMLQAARAPAPAPASEGEPPASPEKAPLPPYVQSRLRLLTAPGVDKAVHTPSSQCGRTNRHCRQRTMQCGSFQ